MIKYFIPFIMLLAACNSNDDSSSSADARDYRQDMRDYVVGISQKAKTQQPGFIVIPQNGIELVSISGEDNGPVNESYLAAIDGNGQEDLNFGYDNDNQATNAEDTAYLNGFLSLSKSAGKTILVTDYCSSPDNMTASYQANAAKGYISFAAPERSLNVIPQGIPNNLNTNDITQLSQAKNFLYLINPENYISKEAFINAVSATNYDAVIMDLFLGDDAFTAEEITQLKTKANGGKRLVICYMSIGEAEDYRYYWQDAWNTTKPDWIATENPDWPGNFKVKYWNDEWQGIIYKNDGSYLDKILTAGFNGVYLDIIDAFEYFE